MLEWIQNRIRILRSENVVDLYSNTNPFSHVEDIHRTKRELYENIRKNSKQYALKLSAYRQKKNKL